MRNIFNTAVIGALACAMSLTVAIHARAEEAPDSRPVPVSNDDEKVKFQWTPVEKPARAKVTHVADAKKTGPIYWRSCGFGDPPTKLVKLFPITRHRDAKFLCGNHQGGDQYGFYHMKANKARWEGLTPGTGQSWQDIADLAMVETAWSPLRRISVPGGQQCRDDILALRNLQTGQVVRRIDVRMYVRESDWRINTVIPGGPC